MCSLEFTNKPRNGWDLWKIDDSLWKSSLKMQLWVGVKVDVIDLLLRESKRRIYSYFVMIVILKLLYC